MSPVFFFLTVTTLNRDPIPDATLWDLLRWLLRRRRRLRVVGESMLPTLLPGDTVLIDPRAYRDRLPAAGDIVTLMHPAQPKLEILKRVHFLDDAGGCYLLSDNPTAGTDSRTFGVVPRGDIRGRVTCRIKV